MSETDSKAFWNELTYPQQEILKIAYDGAIIPPAEDLRTQTEISGLFLFGLLRHGYGVNLFITPKGRAVYEAGNPPAAPDSSIPQPLTELAEARERIRELERLAMPFAYAWQRYLEIDNGDTWLEFVNRYFDSSLMAANYEDLAAALTRKP